MVVEAVAAITLTGSSGGSWLAGVGSSIAEHMLMLLASLAVDMCLRGLWVGGPSVAEKKAT